ncbi:MAG: ATP-dependent helicase HrpB [Anaerolineae bacterium]|nr:ATP-dependent helicase HrpB [Thermoflexales bacterium]MDW8407858.1 ATP-dependent helicase HrpB [Anaerolineae bacterium]
MLIDAILPDLKACLQTQPIVMVQAPPGAGKSTVVPLALLDENWLNGRRILMLEPRRLAARAIAGRMADLLGEPLGERVGYRVRFEHRVGPRSRVEVLTEGILTRRLQHDPILEGVGLVIFDEFHERSLDADLALALCRDVQATVRPDLRLLIMSATLDDPSVRAALSEAPLLRLEGAMFPVTMRYVDRESRAPLHEQATQAVLRAAGEHAGDILVFLPGAAEIHRTQAALAAQQLDLVICPLYGDLPLAAQQTAITPDRAGRRKVVLATSIAETSLTIEGVRVVIDTGFARVPRFDPRTGLTRLETVRVSRDSADQRAGRAGRLAPGVCYRLWTEQTQRRLKPAREPEILEADLAAVRLEMAQWGAHSADALPWITSPPAGALAQATALLKMLGALDASDPPRITDRGRRLLEWGTHPRLAHLLDEAAQLGDVEASLAADIAALLEERDPLPEESSADFTLRLEALRHWRASPTGRAPAQADVRALGRIEQLAARWRRMLKTTIDNSIPAPVAVGHLIALAYPDRIAQRRGDAAGRYKLALGRAARLPEHDPMHTHEWLAVAQVDSGQQAEGRIFLAAPLEVRDVMPLATEHDVVGWDGRQGVLIAQRERRIGALAIETRPLPQPPPAERLRTLCDVVRQEGLSVLNWTEAAQQWRARAQSLHIWRGAPWPDFSDSALLAQVEAWLGAWLGDVTRREDFGRLDVLAALQQWMPASLRPQLDALAPERIAIPSGSRIRLRYALDGSPPVLAARIQELFGLQDTPTVNDGQMKVLVHLLSPAQRPVQVTQDLHSFWRNTYPHVRKELRGRYPKHAWPEDPFHLPAKRGAGHAGSKAS